MPEAGWYDDPQGGGGKRWWDGERWSEHTTPPAGSMPQVPATPPAPPGAPAAGGWDQQATPAAGTWQPTAATPAATGSTATAKKGGAGKIVALVVVVLVVVVGIGVFLVIGLFSLSGSGDVDVVVSDIVQDDGQTAEVPEDGTWETEVDLPAGLVVIDVRGLDGFDPVLELYDASGNRIDRNDDRSMSQEERYGGDAFDSLLEVDVPAGRYRVVVEGFAGEGGRATVSFPITGG